MQKIKIIFKFFGINIQIYAFVIFEIQKFQQIEKTTRYEVMTSHVAVK